MGLEKYMANIRELLGDAYKEDMTFAEVESALTGKDLVDLSTGKYVSKSKYDTVIGERDDFKNKYNSTLTDAQKAEAEAKEREERYKAIERENSINRYDKKLSSSIKDSATRTEIATLMADGKYDEAIDKQNTYLASETAAMEQRIKDDLMKQNPQANAQSGGGGAVTKEQFAAMGVAERTKLFREQPEIYKSLNEQ
jgi:hypothetical protein